MLPEIIDGPTEVFMSHVRHKLKNKDSNLTATKNMRLLVIVVPSL